MVAATSESEAAARGGPLNVGEGTRKGVPDTYKLRMYAEGRKTALIQEREPYMQDWQEASDYVDPSRGRFSSAQQPSTGENSSRRRRSRNKIINNTATICLRTAAAGFASHMTSKSRPWFEIEAPDSRINDLHSVRTWTAAATEEVRSVLAKSNFYKAMPDAYTEDVMFGVTAILMPAHPTEVIRFHPLTAGSYAIGLGADGQADTLYREFPRTAKQLLEEYGPDNLTDVIVEAAKKTPDRYFLVAALIEPNPDERPGLGPLGLQAEQYRPYRELIWISGNKDKRHGCLRIRGYYEKPFVAGRFAPLADEVYSPSPVLDSLGDIKQLQYQEGQKLRLIDLAAEPPLGLPTSMKNTPASLSPRSKTYHPDGQNAGKAEVLYEPNPNAIQFVMNDIRTTESRIQNAMFYPLFLMLSSLDDRERTATEIAERRDERATVLGPTVESVTDELLDQIVIRVFRELERRGRIAPAPPELSNHPLKIEYTSILAQAMKSAGITAIERSVSFVVSSVQATGDQSLLDKVDFDQAVDEISSRLSAPPSVIRSDEAVAKIRADRAQQQQMERMAQMAKPMADAANAFKTMAETVPEEGSAMEAMGMAGAM